MATNTNTNVPTFTDEQVYALKELGFPWRAIFEAQGGEWHPQNMDGGRMKRAYLRAKKAEVDAAQVKLPTTILTRVQGHVRSKAVAAKMAEKAQAAKPARKPRTRKAAPKVTTPEGDAKVTVTDDTMHIEG